MPSKWCSTRNFRHKLRIRQTGVLYIDSLILVVKLFVMCLCLQWVHWHWLVWLDFDKVHFMVPFAALISNVSSTSHTLHITFFDCIYMYRLIEKDQNDNFQPRTYVSSIFSLVVFLVFDWWFCKYWHIRNSQHTNRTGRVSMLQWCTGTHTMCVRKYV